MTTPRRRAFVAAALIAFVAFLAGLAGAWAFNPDDGAVARSEALWRAFGITAYVAWGALVVLFVGWTVAALTAATRRRRR